MVNHSLKKNIYKYIRQHETASSLIEEGQQQLSPPNNLNALPLVSRVRCQVCRIRDKNNKKRSTWFSSRANKQVVSYSTIYSCYWLCFVFLFFVLNKKRNENKTNLPVRMVTFFSSSAKRQRKTFLLLLLLLKCYPLLWEPPLPDLQLVARLRFSRRQMACVSVSVCLFGCVKRKTRKRRGNVEMRNYTACCGLLLRKTKFTTWERVFDVYVLQL